MFTQGTRQLAADLTFICHCSLGIYYLFGWVFDQPWTILYLIALSVQLTITSITRQCPLTVIELHLREDHPWPTQYGFAGYYGRKLLALIGIEPSKAFMHAIRASLILWMVLMIYIQLGRIGAL